MMKIKLTRLCGPAALALALGPPVWAEPLPQRRPDPPPAAQVESLSLADAHKLLTEAHFRAETVESPGTPYLKSQSGTGFFFLTLYDCADAAKAEGCRAMELTSGAFALRPAPSGEALARWNAASGFGFGVFDSSGSPYLRATLLLAGGVSEAHIKASLTLWAERMTAFAKFIEATAAPPSSASTPQGQADGAAAAPNALH
jgi:hypothetical protein